MTTVSVRVRSVCRGRHWVFVAKPTLASLQHKPLSLRLTYDPIIFFPHSASGTSPSTLPNIRPSAENVGEKAREVQWRVSQVKDPLPETVHLLTKQVVNMTGAPKILIRVNNIYEVGCVQKN